MISCLDGSKLVSFFFLSESVTFFSKEIHFRDVEGLLDLYTKLNKKVFSTTLIVIKEVEQSQCQNTGLRL